MGYVIGVARNACLHRRAEDWEQAMERAFEQTRTKQRLNPPVTRTLPKSWNREQRIITRLEFGSQAAVVRCSV